MLDHFRKYLLIIYYYFYGVSSFALYQGGGFQLALNTSKQCLLNTIFVVFILVYRFDRWNLHAKKPFHEYFCIEFQLVIENVSKCVGFLSTESSWVNKCFISHRNANVFSVLECENCILLNSLDIEPDQEWH